MTPRDKLRLDYYEGVLGKMTSDEALELAIRCEELAKLNPADMGFNKKFFSDAQMLQEYALLLERSEQETA